MNTIFIRWKFKESGPSKYRLTVSPDIFCNPRLFSLVLPSHLHSYVPAPIASEEYAQVGLGFEFTGWCREAWWWEQEDRVVICVDVTRDRGEQGPPRGCQLGQDQPPHPHPPAPPWLVQDAWSSDTSQGRPSDGDAGLTDLASIANRMRHALGDRVRRGTQNTNEVQLRKLQVLCFSLYASRLSREIYTCSKNTALFFP